DRVEDRPVDLARGADDDVREVVGGAMPGRQLPVNILNHHDGTVHENTEVDGPDGEKVGRDVPEVEKNEGEEERERDRRGDDQPRSYVVEEEDQNHQNQDDPAEEIVFDG